MALEPQDVANAELDIDTIGAFVNGSPSDDVTNRAGATFPSLQKVIASSSASGRRVFATLAERDEWEGRPPGAQAYVSDTDLSYRWTGTTGGWVTFEDPTIAAADAATAARDDAEAARDEALNWAHGPGKGDKGDPGGNVMAVGTFQDIAALTWNPTTRPKPDALRTTGWSTPGIAAAFYKASDGTGGASAIQIQDSDGNWWLLDGQIIDPRASGAMISPSSDDAPAITLASSVLGAEVVIGAASPPLSATPAYNLKTTALLNFRTDVRGTGRLSRVQSDLNASGLENLRGTSTADGKKRLLRWNIDAAGGWIQPFPGPTSGRMENLVLQYRGVGSSRYKVTGVEFGGSMTFDRVNFDGLAGGIRQIPEYCDQVAVSRTVSFNPFIPSNAALEDGYDINLGYTGDGIIIDACHAGGGLDENGASVRGRLIYARYKGGMAIRGSINGDHVIVDSHAVTIDACHMEHGQFRLINTSASLRGNIFYMRGPSAGNRNVIPLIFESKPGGSGVSSQVCAMQEQMFEYTGRFSDGRSADLHNFKLEGNGAIWRGQLHVLNCSRFDHGDQDFTFSQQYGVTCGDPVFDSYTHIASRESWYRRGEWHFSDRFGPILTGAGFSSATLLGTRTWSAASGTYYYRAVLLYDKFRMVGVAGTAEVSASPVNGGPGPHLGLDDAFIVPGILRVYRGTAAGVYDRYVDLAPMSGRRVNDGGNDVAGFPWISRAPGGIDVINANSAGGFAIEPGERATTSDAYGHATVYLSAQTPPTTGGWRRGDKALLLNPDHDNFIVLVGYLRRTNCQSTSPSNILGNDWLPIYEEIAPAQATTAQLGSSTHLSNTKFKFVGRSFYNTTDQKAYWATNVNPASAWRAGDGSTIVPS